MAGKKGSSGKNKYNWDEMKMEFMLGEWGDVSSYLQFKGMGSSARNSNTFRNTEGWAEEKKNKRKKIYEQVAQETQEKLKANLEKGYHNLLNVGILSKLADMERLKSMDTSDIERLWKILRTEHGLPTTIKLVGEDQKNKFTSYAEIMKHLMTQKEKENT